MIFNYLPIRIAPSLRRTWHAVGPSRVLPLRNLARFAWSVLLLGSVLTSAGCRIQGNEPASGRQSGPRHVERMLCGTVGSITLKFPAEYTFLGVTYMGTDHWGPGRRDQANRCSDPLSEATFSLKWPELEAAGGRSWYTSEDPRYLTISVSHNASQDPRQIMLDTLQHEAGDGLQPLIPRDIEEIYASRSQSNVSGLFAFDADTFSPANRRRVLWSHLDDRSISIVIVCSVNTSSGSSRCSQKSFDESRGVWLTISYRIAMLPKWREIQKESIWFIDGLTINHKDA